MLTLKRRMRINEMARLICVIMTLFILGVIDEVVGADTRMSPGGGGLDDHTIALWLFDDPQYPQMDADRGEQAPL